MPDAEKKYLLELIDYIIETLETSFAHNESMLMIPDTNHSLIHHRAKVIDNAITYSKEIKEKLQ